MKKLIISAGIISSLMVSCTKTESKTETVQNPDGTVTTINTTTQKKTTLDSAKINETVDNVKEKLNKAGEKVDSTADKVGEKLDKAGKNLKNAAAKGAEKIEKGAKDLQEDLKKDNK